MFIRLPFSVVLVVALALAPQYAAAQTRWAVLSAASSRDEAGRARDVAEHAFAALEAQGESVMPRERAAARVEGELSRSFLGAPDELITRLGRTAEGVLEDVAFGRLARARDAGEPVLDAAEQHIVALGRIETAARDAANLCLYLVRADIQDQREDDARQLVARCLRLRPTLDVDERLHPGRVRDLVREVRRDLDAGTTGGILSIQGAASEPEGCTIRVNGAEVGRTPWARVPLPAGSYGVQIECLDAMPGRVFPAQLERGQPARITVAARLSQSLETRGGISLVYTSESELRGRIAADIALLGAVLGVERVLVAVADGGTVAYRAFELTGDVSARVTGSAPVLEPVDEAASREAIASVRSGRRLAEASTAQDEAASGAATTDSGDGSDVGVAVLGGSFLTVGAVGLAVSWYFWTEIDARGQEINRATGSTELTERQRAFNDALLPVALTGMAGAALATAALPMLLPEEDGVPWWSWVIGAAGLGVGVAGAYVLATDGACYSNALLAATCIKQSPNELLGTLVLGHAAPLLTVPVTYLVRDAIGSGDRPGSATLRVQPMGAGLSFSGSF